LEVKKERSNRVTGEDLGYGTEYEKQLLGHILGDICKRYNIKKVYQYPSNDLLGDTTTLFGLSVEHSTHSYERPPSGTADLVWTFCELEKWKSPSVLLLKMERLSSGYIFVVSQNLFNPGVFFHRLWHSVGGLQWDHGFIDYMRISYLAEVAKAMHFRVLETGYFDVPWFILDLYETGRYLRGLVPASLIEKGGLSSSMLESIPSCFKRVFAHHGYALLAK
jgi:hypothetical protein